ASAWSWRRCPSWRARWRPSSKPRASRARGSAEWRKDRADARCAARAARGARARTGARRTMPDKARVAVMLSGNGTTMSSLLYHSRLPGCPYEIVLVVSNMPGARGLKIAEAEGIATFAHSHKGMEREAHEAVMD